MRDSRGLPCLESLIEICEGEDAEGYYRRGRGGPEEHGLAHDGQLMGSNVHSRQRGGRIMQMIYDSLDDFLMIV